MLTSAIKNLFFIHSPITYYLSELIIYQNKIKDDDIVFISESYKPPLASNRKVTYFESSILSKFFNINLPKQVDRFIKREIGDFAFNAYIDLPHIPQRIIITNKNCVSFSFMEEGLASYKKASDWDFLTRIAKSGTFRSLPLFQIRDFVFFMRGVNAKLLSLPFEPSAYRYFNNVNYFCLSELAFPSVNNHKINLKSDVFNASVFIQEMLAKDLNNSIVWIEESFARNNGYTDSEYEQVILKTINNLDFFDSKIVYLKLRPKQAIEQSVVYKILKSKGVSVIIFEVDLIIEPYFFYCKDITVIGVVSSLLFYATIANHKVYSMHELFKAIKKPKRNFDDLTFMWDSISCIENR
jgi:hypothetical protein